MSISFIYPQYLWLLLLIPLTLAIGLLGRQSLNRARLWSSLSLRTAIMLMITLALAGIQLRLPADILTTVFILDASDSIPAAEQARGEALIRQAIDMMPAGDRAAVVVFGKNALVERLATESRLFPDLASVPVTTRTDITSALQLALALLPDEGAKRFVLLSDGQENIRQAVDQAELAAAQGIELLFAPLGSPGGETEVIMESLDAPSAVRQGQDFTLTAIIHSTAQTAATLYTYGEGALIESREVRLQPGTNRIQIDISASATSSTDIKSADIQSGDALYSPGFRRFRAQIIPTNDTRLQNNQASAFTVVHGPPSILLVEGTPGEAQNLYSVLQAAEMNVTRISPEQMPNTLLELARYDAIALINVHASVLPLGILETLPVFARELGHGLLMTGGQDSFGAGGYLRTPLEEALPVDMDVRNKEFQANLALVLAVDKSGSMGRCHCDNPDLNQTYTRREVGQPKVDIAKEAIMRAASALGKEDFLGVVAFDNLARWVLPVEKLVDPLALEGAIGTFQAEGQTNLQSGVQAAYQALSGIEASRKHIILMTDGWVHRGDLTALAEQMKSEGITLSIVAAGEGSAEYLQTLAISGGGRYYPATDVLSVPDIFLKETVVSVGQYIVEEAFYPLPAMPGPVLHGLDTANLPPLLGYNGTTAKNTARLDLITPRGDPLLATWQYGLGRAAVWTSDIKAQWAREWLGWSDFARFSAQLINWILPSPQAEGLTARTTLEDDEAIIQLEALDKDGRPLNFLTVEASLVDPSLQSTHLPLEQVGPGEYQARAQVAQPGAYLVRIGANMEAQSLGQTTLGFVVPYSPEYKTSGIDLGILLELARVTGGEELTQPSDAFIHNLIAVDYAREIWRPILLLVALLFPLDVAGRRVIFGASDFAKARAWLSERLRSREKADDEQTPMLGRLFNARERVRHRQNSEDQTEDHAEHPRPQAPAPLYPPISALPKDGLEDQDQTQVDTQPEQASQESPGDTLSRLREAKRRTRR